MSNALRLSIPQPCHENWQQMTPNERGRHCMACQKTVVDFSLLSDQEILQYISTANSQLCGRFSSDQLDKVYKEQQQGTIKKWRYIWNAVVVGFLFTGNAANAQSKKTPVKKVKISEYKPSEKTNVQPASQSMKRVVELPPVDTLILVEGIQMLTGIIDVVDEVTIYEKFRRQAESWLPTKEIKVYPSQVIPLNSFSVILQLKDMGAYRMMLIDDLSNKVVYMETLQVEQEQHTIQLLTEPTWRRGVYWLRVTHMATKESYQTKVLLQ